MQFRINRFFLLLFCGLGMSFLTWAQNGTGNATTLRRQMAKIRQSTNWNDPVAAKKANEQIRI